MKVVIFAVVYNNLNDTIIFCDSIMSQKHLSNFDLNCYLIDNSSDAEISNSLDNLVNRYPFLYILRPDKNLGYFGAFNYALSFDFHTNANYTLLCNNDLIFTDDFFQNLSLNNYDNDFLAICPDIVTLNGRHQNPHVIKPFGFLRRLKLDLYFSHYYVACFLEILKNFLNLFNKNFKKLKSPSTSSSMAIHMGIGACYILPSAFFINISKLNYPFFLYGEEAFLSKQIHDANGKLFYDPSLRVAHAESATLSKIPRRLTYEFAREGYPTYRKFY